MHAKDESTRDSVALFCGKHERAGGEIEADGDEIESGGGEIRLAVGNTESTGGEAKLADGNTESAGGKTESRDCAETANPGRTMIARVQCRLSIMGTKM